MSSQKITAFGFTFDATKVAPQQPMEAVPRGWYSVVITDGELKPTEGGNGQRIALEWTITEGQYKGRKIFDGFNIVHSNAQAQQIAAGQVSAICHATGTFQVADVSQLFNKPHQIKVDVDAERWVDADNNQVEPNTPNAKRYDPKNTFKGAKAGSAPATAAGPAPAGSAAAPATAAGAAANPPWAVTTAGAAPGNGAVAPTPAPASATAAPTPAAAVPPAVGKPAKPGKKPAKPVPAAAPPVTVERKFFVGIDGPDYAEAWPESKVREAISKGMPADTPLCLEGESDWKTATEYAVGVSTVTAAPQTPAAVVPATTPATVAAPAAATPAATLPPWLR